MQDVAFRLQYIAQVYVQTNTRRRHGRSRGETKYSMRITKLSTVALLWIFKKINIISTDIGNVCMSTCTKKRKQG